MKRIENYSKTAPHLVFGLLFILFLSTYKLSARDIEKGIDFQSGSWQQVLDLAKTENKLIFLDLYASWCGPCKALKANTFPDASLGKFFNENFISYAADAEKGFGIELARLYNLG